MENYGSQQQETRGNIVRVPHYYQNVETNLTGKYHTMGEYSGDIPTLNTVAQGYDRNEKLREILGNNLL
ncbi:hypothetical protein [Clostridium sp. JNZ J1-5]